MITPEYIAGFFDGEGHVSAWSRWKGKAPNVQMRLSQRRPEVLRQIQEVVGGKLNCNTRGSWTLCVTGKNNSLAFIELILPFSIVKREELEIAREILILVGRQSEDAKRRRIELGLKMLEVRHGK